jgi:hypothetical protein
MVLFFGYLMYRALNPDPGAVLAAGDESRLAGTWRGTSSCVEKGTACQDEVAVYRVAAIAGKPAAFTVTGGKMVDGKEVVMGSVEGRWEAAKHTLSVKLPGGAIALTLDRDTLTGTFTLPDKRVLRHITLKKSDRQ